LPRHGRLRITSCAHSGTRGRFCPGTTTCVKLRNAQPCSSRLERVNLVTTIARGIVLGPIADQLVLTSTHHGRCERPERKRRIMPCAAWLDLSRWPRERQEGQTMAEYAVVLGVITLAVVGVFTALAGGVSGAISTVTSRI